MSKVDLDQLAFPVYALQGGGLGRMTDGRMVFYELPDWCPAEGFDPEVGDVIPADWDYLPANAAAMREATDVYYGL